MSGIKTYVQTNMQVAPTEQNHLVRLQDMIDYVSGITKQSVDVVLNTLFDATYNSTDLTLTQNVAEELIIEGITLAVNDRILIAGQLDQTQNGIYAVTTLGVTGTTAAVLTRASDFNTSADLVNGIIIPISLGNVNGNTRWKLTVGSLPAVLDSTNLEFSKETVDFTKVVEMTFPIVGDTTTVLYAFQHDLDSLNVTHELRDDTTGETVVALFRRTSVNNCEVEFGVPLGVGTDLTLIIRAQVDPI
jgi:hypothetical protein